MQDNLFRLTTEQVNQNSKHIDEQDAMGIVKIMNKEDENTVEAVRRQLPQIALAIDAIVERLSDGGRMFYVGAGTSGRLGVLDASECVPTFGVPAEMVQGIMAGGEQALHSSLLDGLEDDFDLGQNSVSDYKMTEKDVVVGITASGRTPFVLGALQKAQENNIFTIGLCNNDEPSMKSYCNIVIAPVVGPEVIVGSTRLKSGTSQKMVLNMLSTGSMIKLGKVYDNYMVDVVPNNEKLIVRAVRIVKEITGIDTVSATKYLELSGMNAKVAIIMILTESSKEEAEELLTKSNGFIAKAIKLRVN
ncbi:N-acetylmuramic acid 6-phosphate etherase [Paenibacillus macquariensis]|uniref:N-acetylmuramic acid 6-phosphate etherase n=1 Tax=Paenibacillus macquariensis TaxID=948756 RepID=A0ABY1KB10_9BACL|nr:N-acetylmuramic acid 6-phosphate etherase [Paenibacillus macquariensis]MEC0089534.1 N-acetylmuramic acid 6-phosphate etherase [Paenibacillus macquariensis]OAB25795.1 N-acetylmuramic acid 6-phosphate etherase [Paenibacillus macquariensis subsp. macquariensis]SIR53381.1 N-acetylmuramic acid 6-phosphate etherase [Paenibacillus macquariensis]